jgi:hypothetical protein
MNISSLFLGTALVIGQANATAPVKTIDMYVMPYYVSSESKSGHPAIAVAQMYDALLAEGGAESLKKVADDIEADDGFITPVTMMVLAIRFYDAGIRDDSVFWFYVAKGRFLTSSRVLDFSSPRLFEVGSAIGAFATLAGPYINGYAFCDISKQQVIKAKAVEWVASHPYKAVFVPSLPALSGNRQKNLDSAVTEMRKQALDETHILQDPEALKTLVEGRKENNTDSQFCWK